ncbi:Putative ATP:guanido phosphotransferase YacI [Fimbriimonas ginsengisoli Gsoil 348]|uniref:Putative ATP:guanido phosphotransferase YacI n=1 Tax=Fimbriimonas ginsengisoli Gsoil 348 TaxID=661478 RepID=A0A068NS06_FIMGI|nr:Putative ATP:guanido phosphotransferase YacI [Fimbriimonas ginsengisoli Gsoil 348]
MGHRFPNGATVGELQDVMRQVLDAARDADLALDTFKGLTNAERDHLVACRLVSPDFEWTLPGRALLVDARRSLSVMVNEEDHLRIQSLSAGWSVSASDAEARACLDALSSRLPFSFSPEFGYLSASPFNCGSGRRRSAMFHLIGLAQSKRLPAVLTALSAMGVSVRGLFGESSRAIGAFVQVSVLELAQTEFAGACEYLLREERESRTLVPRETLTEKSTQARDFAVSSRSLSLADALRVLAWIRWASVSSLPGFPSSPRAADAALTTLDIRGTMGEEHAARQRADALRAALGA